MAEPEEMSRDELIVVARDQAEKLVAQDRQITAMAGQLSELEEANQALADKLARLEHLLSRNSSNSSNPPSRDEDPGKPAAPTKKPRRLTEPRRESRSTSRARPVRETKSGYTSAATCALTSPSAASSVIAL